MDNRIIKFRWWNGQAMIPHENLLVSIKNIHHNKPLMQFTGLIDINKKYIYESDILKDHGIVAWNDVNHCWSRIDLNWNEKREWHELDSLTSPMEVIGNIHQNPELIN
tara:strand:- start:15001 stop:15324 length:324 start_codon:yes stop_codon:yes gene_type:complete